MIRKHSAALASFLEESASSRSEFEGENRMSVCDACGIRLCVQWWGRALSVLYESTAAVMTGTSQTTTHHSNSDSDDDVQLFGGAPPRKPPAKPAAAAAAVSDDDDDSDDDDCL